jgi:hypothetical protein
MALVRVTVHAQLHPILLTWSVGSELIQEEEEKEQQQQQACWRVSPREFRRYWQ